MNESNTDEQNEEIHVVNVNNMNEPDTGKHNEETPFVNVPQKGATKTATEPAEIVRPKKKIPKVGESIEYRASGIDLWVKGKVLSRGVKGQERIGLS